ncbi:MAG TPA: amidase, partial [Burkholderiaceae bacterium]|nr:amidase [Burkholderiaceae bacterium]
MRRRDFVAVAALALAMTTRTARATARFAYLEAGADALRRRMEAGRLSARALAAAYLRRIERIDRHGPRLNAVIETNPDALEIAAELDRER